MTLEIALVFAILATALVLFITEWIRMDLTAILVLCALAMTGLVTPTEAVSGFSNAAVITIWAMFILGEGMTRSGIADILGRSVLYAGGRGEARVIATLMLTTGTLSAFMNNVGVAALMLPVAVGVARRTGISPSRLLMPVAFGTHLGGLTTLIGTPPNLIVSTTLDDAGLQPFGFFDFTPVGATVFIVGTAFVALIGRHLLPKTTPKDAFQTGEDLRASYSLQERIFAVRIPKESLLDGNTIADAGLTSAAGLMVIARTRGERTDALPTAKTVLHAGDTLLVQGRREQFDGLRKWSGLVIEREAPLLTPLITGQMPLRALKLADDSSLIGDRLLHNRFRDDYGINILALRRNDLIRRTRLSDLTLQAGDMLLAQCSEDRLESLESSAAFGEIAEVNEADLHDAWQLDERLFAVRVPEDAPIAGTTMSESRLGDAFDFRLLAFQRGGELITMPKSDETIQGGDIIIVEGREEDLAVLRGLQQLEIERDATPYLHIFEHGQLDMVEAAVHPHSTLKGKTIDQLDFRGRQQIEVAAIWRNGRPYRSQLGAMTLEAGDGLLFVGPRDKLASLNINPNLIALNPVSAPIVDTRMAPVAAGWMLFVVATVLLGWLTIPIAAIGGAAGMLVTRCLNMEQAYRAIDWRSVFLIAGMLPLGIAMQETGAATLVAQAAVNTLGGFGPWAVIGGLYLLTVAGTLAIPTVALVVLTAPIALTASLEMGVSPHTAMMAVTIAAAASFASPVAHPANVLVMGPGGYRYADYLKLGIPLAALTALIVALLLPIAWPL